MIIEIYANNIHNRLDRNYLQNILKLPSLVQVLIQVIIQCSGYKHVK